ncbi:MAG: hypothetical protein KatS3mg124_0702 [Porticoccaceae bacterium]|nr:MAG: hypothetical protein KatS3mg124_0702 [Porticoccaceae bacterium]
MLAYWLLYGIPALAALAERVRVRRSFAWAFYVGFLVLAVGLRDRVGGDWPQYLEIFRATRYLSLAEAAMRGDPGYQAVNWLCQQLGLGIWGVNLLCALLFAWGLAAFCRAQPRPWLALAVAVPYLVIVVAMGYTRQAVALGLAMRGLVHLGEQRHLRFALWVLLGALFHKTAVILLPVAALAATRRRLWTAVWVALVTVLAYQLLLEEAVDTLYTNYLERRYQSQGAFIRLAMNTVAAVLFLLWRRRFACGREGVALWTWFAWLSLALLAILLLSPSTTAVDRVGLYFLPLQLVVFARLPDALGGARPAALVGAVVAYYGAVLFVWLHFAYHAHAWLPYRNFLFS